ncbi:cyclophane-forming radical SAM/SPASM peptide maturase GrrM/OscB [Desulfarculus baarsii]
MGSAIVNKVRLLTMQPTSACNLRCRYCYLGRHKGAAVMDLAVLRAALARLAAEDLLGPELTISWHMGEPLTAGKDFFRQAFALTERMLGGATRLGHSIQTNGTLIDDQWAALFAEHDVKVGLSLDGPTAVHDANRVLPDGSGSHARVMAGLDCLRRSGVRPSIICVVNQSSIDRAEELRDFFRAEGLWRINFNIEEIEGAHERSFVKSDADWRERYRRFLAVFHAAGVAVRDLENVKSWLADRRPRAAGAALPLHHLSIDATGGFSSFSPELLSASHPAHGDFILGNVTSDAIAAAMGAAKGQRLWAQIKKGLLRCKAECPHFGLCGGGYPSNKLFENGSFDSARTTACEAGIIIPLAVASHAPAVDAAHGRGAPSYF